MPYIEMYIRFKYIFIHSGKLKKKKINLSNYINIVIMPKKYEV